ncbi:hypothetical protein HYX18_03565 [Candidatus Woesearchaeota archaeon]|nr:hypothetical protein [Candidatus Woesearchaeota archaeon]
MGLFDFWKKEDKLDKKFKVLHNNLSASFSNIKKDMENFSKWVMHLEKHRTHHHSKIGDIEKKVYFLEKMLEDIKIGQTFVRLPDVSKHGQTFVRLKQTAVGVQTGVDVVQTPVQTAIQTFKPIGTSELKEILRNLTVMERAVLWTLLNTDLKMSYDDLAVLLGKDKSTLRGQITNIKRKSDDLIKEFIENNGKKRFFVDENIKKMMIMGLKNDGNSTKIGIYKKTNKESES